MYSVFESNVLSLIPTSRGAFYLNKSHKIENRDAHFFSEISFEILRILLLKIQLLLTQQKHHNGTMGFPTHDGKTASGKAESGKAESGKAESGKTEGGKTGEVDVLKFSKPL